MKIYTVSFSEISSGNRYNLFDTSERGLKQQMAKTRKDYNYNSSELGFYGIDEINFKPTKKGILEMLKHNFTNASTNG